MASKGITSFSKEYAFLSNDYPCSIHYEGMDFPSVEHAFQASKSWDVRDRLAISVAPSLGHLRQAAQRIQVRDDWEKDRLHIMWVLLTEKFRDPKLREQLLATGDAVLIWRNRSDRFWGQVKGEGENWLGKHLMNIRKKLQNS